MATYKKFGKLFEPLGHEHRTLHNVRKGELTEPFNMASVGLDPKNKASPKLLQTTVEDEFSRWKQVHKNNIDYIAIDMAQVDDNAYVLQAFLQPDGEKAFDALERGLVWSNELKAPDIDATIAYYGSRIAKGQLGERTWGPITNLAREYPELRPLRAEIVYLRMQGDMKQGSIIKPPVSA